MATDTNVKIDKAACEVLGWRLYKALSGRGHTPSEMLAMEPIERLREYAGWVLGDRGWADDFVSIWKKASFDQ